MRLPLIGTLGPVAEEKKEFPPKSFSFSAAGWLKMYYWGVAKCLQVHGLAASEDVQFIGSSAGALASAGLVVGSDFDKVKEASLDKVDKVHGQFFSAFRLREYVGDVLQSALKEGDEDRLNGRLTVCVTTIFPWISSRNYKSFKSTSDLKDALLASSCVPVLAGMPFVYRGELVFDGGFTQFQPIIDNQTVTVSAMYFSDADIKPSRYIPAWWAVYPPRREDFEWVFDLGYIDTIAWLERNGAHKTRKQGAIHTGTRIPKTPEKQSYSPSNACRLSRCREQFKNRQESQLDRHERSFKRFFGYRSIWRILPSKWFDKFILLLVTFLLRPLTFGLIYCEVVVVSVIFFFRAVLTTLYEVVVMVLYTLSLLWVFSSWKRKNHDDTASTGTFESWHRSSIIMTGTGKSHCKEMKDGTTNRRRQRAGHMSESGQLGVEVPLTWLSYEAWRQCWTVLRYVVSMLGFRRIGFQEFKSQLARKSTFARIAEHYY